MYTRIMGRCWAIRMLSVFVLMLIILAATGAAEGLNSSNDASIEKKVAYLGRPGVVMITVDYVGTLRNDREENVVYLQPDEAEKKVSLKIPEDLTAGVTSVGSGFVVSPDGYVVTNAHVVDMPYEELKSYFINQAVRWAAKEFPAVFLDYGERYPSTEEDLLEIEDNFKSYRLDYKKVINVYFGSNGPMQSAKAHSAEIRKSSTEQTYLFNNMWFRSGKDVAILKIEGFTDLSTVILGDSNRVDVGDKVVVIGYPGSVSTAFGEGVTLSPETELVPTVTSGIISAKKMQPDGSEAIQTDTTVYHGNSGGPAFDEDGRVIGVATFGSGKKMSSGEWLDLQGYNFLIPINVVKSFMSELGINTASKTTSHMEKGLDYYWSGKYGEAKQEFQKASSLDSQNAYATSYTQMCANKYLDQ
ncbi:MAG: trypsin-like peptidase domain-containing protein [Methanothrix sp.]|nr:trypsin-like peptidase domain-containing protein [Methanothrix sp.]